MHNFFYVKRRRKQETRGKRLNEKSTITDPKPTKKAEDHANLHLKKAGFFFLPHSFSSHESTVTLFMLSSTSSSWIPLC